MKLTLIIVILLTLIVIIAVVLLYRYKTGKPFQNESVTSYMTYVINWWKVTGKINLLYILLGYLVLSPFIKQIPLVSEYLPDEKYSIPTIAACLYLMVQIFMGMFKGEDNDFTLRKFEDSAADFKNRLKAAKQVDILCSSSETFYPILKDIFSKQKIRCRLLLRHPQIGIAKQMKDMIHYIDSYEEIKAENKECNLAIKYCTNTFSRLIIIDNVEVYFGFYKHDTGRLRAKDIEMIHVKTGSYFGNFLLNIAINRFQSIWDTADDDIGQREKLIY